MKILVMMVPTLIMRKKILKISEKLNKSAIQIYQRIEVTKQIVTQETRGKGKSRES